MTWPGSCRCWKMQGEDIPDAVREAADLIDYATVTRYPGTVESVSEEEYADAIRMAEAVVRWAEEGL